MNTSLNRFQTPLSLAVLIVSLAIGGCTATITAPKIRDSVASFDGNSQNSGFIGFASDGSGILTPNASERYDALAVIYGEKFRPALKSGDGLRKTETNTVLIDAQHLVYFMRMNSWAKSGLPAK